MALIPILLAPYLTALSANTRAILDDLDYFIWGVFAADLIIKLTIAPKRRAYLRAHWFDVILVGLPLLRPLRLARSLRTLRLLRASRAAIAGVRVLVIGRRILVQHGLHFVLMSALLVIVASGSLVTVFERDASDATINDLPDGLWWAVTTVTTVGYGDTYPKTDIGRGIGVALMLIGIALFGAVAANLAAFFVEEQEDDTTALLREMNQRLQRLEESLSDRSKDGSS